MSAHKILPVFALFAAAVVHASQQPNQQPPGQAIQSAAKASKEAAEIAAINGRMAVLQAKLAELELRAKIAAKNAEITKSDRLNQPEDFSSVPTVLEISGIDGRIWAVLNTGSGTQTVRAGERVDGWLVTHIQPDSVTVKKGDRIKRLSFGMNPIKPAQPPQPPFAGLPPLPTLPPPPAQ